MAKESVKWEVEETGNGSYWWDFDNFDCANCGCDCNRCMGKGLNNIIEDDWRRWRLTMPMPRNKPKRKYRDIVEQSFDRLDTWLYLKIWRLWCFLNFALRPGHHISEIYNYEGPNHESRLSLEFGMAYNEMYRADVKVGPLCYLCGVWAASGDDAGADEEEGLPWPSRM